MNLTIFFAQIWGPVLLAVGLGIFLSRAYYVGIYRDLQKTAFTNLTYGMFSMAIGIAQVSLHNAWNTLPQVLVSLISWGLLVKGAVFIIAPAAVDRAGDRWVNLNFIPLAGVATLVIGGYLTWFAYLA